MRTDNEPERLCLQAATGKHWVRGVVLYAGTEVIPFSANLHGVPIGRLWSAC
jgi:hypothetical protein